MRLLLPLLTLLSLVTNPVAAVFQDDAYTVDYHSALLGEPAAENTFFHTPSDARSKASLLYTLSDRYVLGAVNPKDGSVVWRQLLSPLEEAAPEAGKIKDVQSAKKSKALLRAAASVVVSGVDGQIAAWGASDGRLLWERVWGDTERRLEDVEVLETGEAKKGITQYKDVVALLGGKAPTIQRLDGFTGDVKWEYKDDSGDAPYQVSASATKVYYYSIHTTMLGSLKIKCLTLDVATGKKLDHHTVNPDNELTSVDHILYVGANAASPILIWTDKALKVLRIFIIGTRNGIELKVVNMGNVEMESISVHAPRQVDAKPHFLVHFQNKNRSWAEVYYLHLKTGEVEKAHSFPRHAGKSVFAATSVDGHVFFTRMTNEEIYVTSSSRYEVLGTWQYEKPADGVELPSPLHAAVDLAAKNGNLTAIRLAVLRSNLDWTMYRNGAVDWTRHEALAYATDAVFVNLPSADRGLEDLQLERNQNPVSAAIHRFRRHLAELPALVSWLKATPRLTLESVGLLPKNDTLAATTRDTFGFHKLVAVATRTGDLIILDAGRRGKVLNTIHIADVPAGQSWSVPQLTAVGDGTIECTNPQKELLEVNITSGDIVSAKPRLQRPGPFNHTIVEYRQVNNEIHGRLRTANDLSPPIWKFSPPPGERISSYVGKEPSEVVAAIGSVLGDRRVLYKHLDPNIIAIATISDTHGTATIHLLEAITGDVIYSAQQVGVDTSMPIALAVSEHWFAYSYSSVFLANSSTSQGHHLVIGELYASPFPNDRGSISEDGSDVPSAMNPAAHTTGIHKPFVVTSSYQIGEPISQMLATQTGQGITSRHLLAVLPESQSIIGIPRFFLNARRPKNRAPTSAEQEEGLIQYNPVIEFDPKWVLNHRQEVLGVEKVITGPAVLESTSLVFVCGLDVFGTRVTPSFAFDVLGKDFNKFQMLATVAALAVLTVGVAPLVNKKQIDGIWTAF